MHRRKMTVLVGLAHLFESRSGVWEARQLIWHCNLDHRNSEGTSFRRPSLYGWRYLDCAELSGFLAACCWPRGMASSAVWTCCALGSRFRGRIYDFQRMVERLGAPVLGVLGMDAGDQLGVPSDRRFTDCAMDHSALGSFQRRSADEIRPTVRAREPRQRLQFAPEIPRARCDVLARGASVREIWDSRKAIISGLSHSAGPIRRPTFRPQYRSAVS